MLMWFKQCHEPLMTGNGKHTTYKNGDLGDGANGIVSPTLWQYGGYKATELGEEIAVMLC
jgi:hypothetical protein